MKKQREEPCSEIRKESRKKDGYCYEYILSVRESRSTASYKLPLYSVSVRMQTPDGAVSNAEVRDAFADGGRAIVFFNYIVENLATPTDLPYVFEDELVH